MYYPADLYDLVHIEQSSLASKKYSLVLHGPKNKPLRQRRLVRVPFGGAGYQHYRDSTPWRELSHLDHGDPKRRENYRKRHAGEGDPDRKYSPGWASWHYLW